MRLCPGIFNYAVRGVFEIRDAWIEEGEDRGFPLHYRLSQISMDNLSRMMADGPERSRPAYICLLTDSVAFWPIPDTEYTAGITYYEHLRQI